MEGRPWLRILIICLGFALLGWPVWALTQAKEVAVPARQDAAAAPESLHVTVSFAQAPASFELDYLGVVLCRGASPELTFTYDWKVSVPAEGVELLLKADWPQGTPKTAVRVEVSQEDKPLADTTFWTEGGLVETITIPGGSR